MKVKEYASTLKSQGIKTNKKVMRLSKEDKLEEALYAWFISYKEPRNSYQQTISVGQLDTAFHIFPCQ